MPTPPNAPGTAPVPPVQQGAAPLHTPDPEAPRPLLTAHAAIVLLVATVVGAIAGVLTYRSTGNMAGAVLAGLGATGLSVPVLHNLIGG
ncbi:hypothetical protein ACIQHY_31470 [Streptomyces sp. NPDC092359]|uniref:hypothetical protein n=1 Tax=Streptomyces sp. NPDC092359 TaxID=3366014 RepID=UPI0037F70070